MYNFLLDRDTDPVSAGTTAAGSTPGNVQALRYSTYLSKQDSARSDAINGIMNGVIKDKLKIIPKDHK